MSIRITALFLFVTFLAIYAWKDWFKSLCGLILLMAVIEHESMPKSMFGIQGLNLWNILFLGIFLAWLVNRRREGLIWDMPRHISVLLLLYMGVIVAGFLRAVFDRSNIEDYPLRSLISEELINTIKWVLPGLLLFHGCRTRRRVIMALICLHVVYFLIAIQVSMKVPSDAIHSHLALDQTRDLIKDTGYNPVDVSGMLAGAFWAALAILPLVPGKRYRVIVCAAIGVLAYGQAVTGGRVGYIAWVGTGLALCLLKWRKLLLLVPVAMVLLPIVFPAVVDRLFVGFGTTDVSGATVTDHEVVTSGRMFMWPYVIDKIGESPILGHGRKAMYRTGLSQRVLLEIGETSFGHPHNMYLETLLDNGILGSLPIFLFYGMIIVYSAILFRSNNRLYSAIGGFTLAAVLAQLFTGIGSQHFYPKPMTFAMWTAIFLVLRVHVEEKRARVDLINPECYWNQTVLSENRGAATLANA